MVVFASTELLITNLKFDSNQAFKLRLKRSFPCEWKSFWQTSKLLSIRCPSTEYWAPLPETHIIKPHEDHTKDEFSNFLINKIISAIWTNTLWVFQHFYNYAQSWKFGSPVEKDKELQVFAFLLNLIEICTTEALQEPLPQTQADCPPQCF